jgi:multidrug transporter EmrE-like cation transporter
MSYNSLQMLVPVIVVGLANIALNVFAKAAASQGRSFSSAVSSGSFVLALLAGSISLTGLLWVYQSRVGLASAILLMGAISIVGGALVGIFFYGNRLHPVEIGLLFVIAILFGARWVWAR